VKNTIMIEIDNDWLKFGCIRLMSG